MADASAERLLGGQMRRRLNGRENGAAPGKTIEWRDDQIGGDRRALEASVVEHADLEMLEGLVEQGHRLDTDQGSPHGP